jgi:hypothetical protein
MYPFFKIKFEYLSIPEFWIYVKKEQFKFSQLVSEMLLLFETIGCVKELINYIEIP